MFRLTDARWARGAHPTKSIAALFASRARAFEIDARWFQILFLASFLVFGALARDFALTWPQVVLTFAAALATQAAWLWCLKLPNRASWGGYLSAMVSSFGISILVRADSLWVHPLLAMADIDKMGGAAAVFKPMRTGDVQVPDTKTWWQKLFGVKALQRAAAG